MTEATTTLTRAEWQHIEVNVLAHPQVPGEEPNWPFFA